MVLISFSVLREKIMSGEKRQTIRLLNKKWIPVLIKFNLGFRSTLHLWWKSRSKTQRERLRTDILKNIYPKFLSEITEQEALQDGFNDLSSLKVWFKHTYRKVNFKEQQLTIIQW